VFRSVLVTLLAWLGLAGLVDNVVEWQSWFDQGVLVHWQSVKAWISVVLLGWVPFDIPDWVFDYLLIGTIVARDAWDKEWQVPDGFVLKKAPLHVQAMIWFSRRKQELPVFVIRAALWPISFLVIIISPWLPARNTEKEASFKLKDGTKPPPIIITRQDVKRRRLRSLMLTTWSFVGFIPFLFLTSNVLYRFG